MIFLFHSITIDMLIFFPQYVNPSCNVNFSCKHDNTPCFIVSSSLDLIDLTTHRYSTAMRTVIQMKCGCVPFNPENVSFFSIYPTITLYIVEYIAFLYYFYFGLCQRDPWNVWCYILWIEEGSFSWFSWFWALVSFHYFNEDLIHCVQSDFCDFIVSREKRATYMNLLCYITLSKHGEVCSCRILTSSSNKSPRRRLIFLFVFPLY